MLNRFELVIHFTAASGNDYEYRVEPFEIKAFQLSRSIKGLSSQKTSDFNSEKYRETLLSKVKKQYEEDKIDLYIEKEKNHGFSRDFCLFSISFLKLN